MLKIIDRLEYYIWHFENGILGINVGRTGGKSVDLKKSKEELKSKRKAKKRSVSADYLM